MLLHELSDRSGVSIASIKYYRREGLLAPGAPITATRFRYGPEHLERLALITTMRGPARLSIAQIRTVISLIDDPQVPLTRVLAMVQETISGTPPGGHPEPSESPEDPRVAPLLEEMGWPDVQTAPRAGLSALLTGAEESGTVIDPATLARYARHLDALADEDLTAMAAQAPGPPGQEERAPAPISRDIQVRRAVNGMVTLTQLILALRSLSLASRTITRQRDQRARGDG